VLESGCHQMLEAERGRLGIERAATEAPDLVILELGLPGIDGKSVIMVTWHQPGIHECGHERGAALDKPIPPDAGLVLGCGA
jgi:CheY-like chemotaxis protein